MRREEILIVFRDDLKRESKDIKLSEIEYEDIEPGIRKTFNYSVVLFVDTDENVKFLKKQF